jgi:hypothetical protein
VLRSLGSVSFGPEPPSAFENPSVSRGRKWL